MNSNCERKAFAQDAVAGRDAFQQLNSFSRQRQHNMNLIGACNLCLARDQLLDEYRKGTIVCA